MNKHDLFDKYLAGSLSEKETDLLVDLLKDEELGRELVEYSLETKLFIDYGKKVKSKISPRSETSKFKIKRKRKSALPILLIAAMMAFAFLGVQLFNEKNSAEISTKSLVEVKRGGVVTPASKGLEEGDIVHALESSEITFQDGSSVELSAGAELIVQELVLNKVIVLNKGKLKINAMPQDLGKLKVITRDSSTEVIGTRFSVHKLQVGTILEVYEGRVRYSNEKEVIEVTKGGIAYTDPQKGMIKLKSSNKNALWELWNKLNKNDGSLHFYTGFTKGSHSGKLIAGQIKSDSKNRSYLSEGTILFPESVDFKVGNEITMFAWVRIRQDSIHAPVLTKGDGSWRLQIHHRRPHVGYGKALGRGFLDSEDVLSVERWYMVHQVIYQDRVEVYVNGEKVTDEKVSNVDLNGRGLVMIGGNSDKEGLVFKGDIGEAGLYKRALTEIEIKEMYDLGKFKK